MLEVDQRICNADEPDWSAIAKQAAEEGILLNQQFDAQQMVEQLEKWRDSWELQACAARLYAAESFLYKLLNSTLRNKVMSKANTLGPFCYLLWMYLRFDDDIGRSTLYRGADLTAEMIEEYKRAKDENDEQHDQREDG
ncbi:unnamed protein product [Rotaria sp. Silwood1]|nr:unnamed protein product [Rotaria sp. Silwood1]